MKKFILLLLSLSLANAQWSTDPGSALNLGTGIMPQVAPAPEGGLYVAWLTESNFHIYLQRLNADGLPQWSEGGILVSSQQVDSWIAINHLNLACDSNGNAIITTVDMRSGSWEIYAYKISPGGTELWGADGLALSATGTTNLSPQLTILPMDNSAIVTWMDNYTALRLQRIDSDGNILWDNGGIRVSEANASLMDPQPKISDDGNILVQYIRQTGSFPAAQSQVMIEKYDLNGDPVWPAAAMGPSVGFPMGNWEQDCRQDGQGGAYSSWTELNGTNQTGKVRHINSDGSLNWTDPVEVSLQADHFRISPKLAVTEGSHETYAVWNQSDANQFNRGIYAQFLNTDGERQWGDNGLAVEPLGSSVFYDIHTTNTREDLILSYIRENSSGNDDIIAGRLNSNGDFLWTGNLVSVTNTGTDKTDLTMQRGADCVFLSWSEGGSIRAHRLRFDGTLGPAGTHEPGIIFVPLDYATIQMAIDAAVDFDTILVQPGTYPENLDFSGKEIVLASMMLISGDTSYIHQTIIDGNQQGSVIVMNKGEGPGTRVTGFTIQNGSGLSADPDGNGSYAIYGGGIYCEDVSPILTHLKIRNSSVTNGGGGGLFGSGSDAVLNDVTFLNNESDDVGGGIYVRANSDLTIENCRFIGNHCADVGGAMYARDSSDVRIDHVLATENITDHAGAGFGFKNGCQPVITSSTIADNHAAHFGGSLYSNSSSLKVVNSILWNNEGGEVYFSDFDDSSKIALAYTDITEGNAGITTNDNGEVFWLDGNLDQDPLFADTLNADFGLILNSPAVDAGTALFILDSDTLVNLGSDDYLGETPDMGVFEFVPDTVYYFPMANQRQWQYASDQDTFALTIVDSQFIDGADYFTFDEWYTDEDYTTFKVSGNQVWTRTDSGEVMLYDFAASPGEEWPVSGSNGDFTLSLVGLNEMVETPSGTYESCMAFNRVYGADYEYTEWFAPGVGMVQRDVTTFAGTQRYKLIYTGPVLGICKDCGTQATEYAIEGNYPNPFNPATTIRYHLPASGVVKISIFDLSGRLIRTLMNQNQEAGNHTIRWEGKDDFGREAASGMYFARLESGNVVKTHKMVLLR